MRIQFTALALALVSILGVDANTPSTGCKAPAPMRAITVLKSDPGYNVTGTIEFYQAKAGANVSVVGVIKGLTPNSEKGFHVQ